MCKFVRNPKWLYESKYGITIPYRLLKITAVYIQ